MSGRLKVEKSKFRQFFLPGIAVLFALILFGVWRYFHRVNLAEFVQESSEKKYNILLITIDTLRETALDAMDSRKFLLPTLTRLPHPERCSVIPPLTFR